MVVDADIVLAKCAQIERALDRVAQMLDLRAERLDDQMVADVVALNLQRACQSAIDLAHHLVAAGGLGLPAKLAEAFTLLQGGAGLDTRLAASMRAMVGFRNVAVHAYEELDPVVVARAATQGAADLRAFAAWAVARLPEA